MKIAFDYQVFYWQRYGGISRYIYELATRLARMDGLTVNIFAFAHLNQYLRQCPRDLVVGSYIPAIPKTFRFRVQANIWLSRLCFHIDPPEIVHQTYYSSLKTTSNRSKIVLTVHDMIHEKFKYYFSGNEDISKIKADAIKRADKVICVSDSTKNDLLKILAIEPDKISVIPHGLTSLPLQAGTDVQAYSKRPYILFVGHRQKYKNFSTLLQAYASSEKLKKTISLICFGGDPPSSQEYETIRQLKISENQIFFLSGDDQKLAELYRHAIAFVFPSLYEGFGMPILEAMALNCPVICSNTSSFPEVAGNAAEFFDPYCKESIAGAIEKVLFSLEYRANLIRLGKEQIKEFSWDRCAEKTRSVYLELS